MKCEQRIRGIRWYDVVRKTEVSICRGLLPVSDWILRGLSAMFRHVARLPDNTPAHQVRLSAGRLPDPTSCQVLSL